jgi:predicted nucleic acid-binding protein
LARSHGLCSYDATGLVLAQRFGAALASFDGQFNQAAVALGVALFADP